MTFVERWLARAASVEGVVFDFGGVISVSPRKGWALYPYCESLGMSHDQVSAGFDRYRHLWDGGFISFAEMYRRMFADAGLAITQSQLDELWEIDAVGWIRELRADTLELMRRLRAEGFRIGILTNMSQDFYERLFVPRAADYRALAHMEVVSGLERLYKPERAIYELAERRMELPAAKLLFLDDTMANVEAARRFGWQSELYV